MAHSSIRLKVRRKKVANLATYSQKHTVKNCTIPKIIKPGEGVWDIPEEGFKQTPNMRKKYKKKYYYKDGRIRKIITHPSDWDVFEDRTFRPKGRAWYMEQVTQHKIAKWEKKNPCPIKQDGQTQDLFEDEFLVPWKAKREEALERFRDFVASIYDKLPLIGRFRETETKFKETQVAEIKDIDGEGNKINELDPKKSKLLRTAQKKTNQIKAKNPKLVCTRLKDHNRKKGRIILPKAA